MTSSDSIHTAPQETARLLRLATYASISVALILIVAKLIAWGLSDSVSLLATLIDSVLDALASLINSEKIKFTCSHCGYCCNTIKALKIHTKTVH